MKERSDWKGSENLTCMTVFVVVVILIAAGPVSHVASGQDPGSSTEGSSPNYASSTSWAIGVVVPNNARLAGGGKLSWGQVDNVTAQVALPEINYTDGAVLAVLSLMTTDGNVLQLAAGIYPTMNTWMTYAQFINDIRLTSENYQWIANGTIPAMSAGDIVTLSIFVSSGVWNYELSDLSNHRSTQGVFPGGGTSFASGDQEVFALESYSENSSVFAHMGNLTLQSLTVDGRRVIQGYYFYSNLDWQSGPLFVVGGYADPPSFISAQSSGAGAIVWSYAGVWTNEPQLLTPSIKLIILVAIAVVLAAVVIFVLARRMARIADLRSNGAGNSS